MGFDFDDGLGEQGARQLQTKQMLAATAVGVFHHGRAGQLNTVGRQVDGGAARNSQRRFDAHAVL